MRAYVGTRSLLSLESLSTNVTFYHYSSTNKAEYDFIPKFLSFPKLKTTHKNPWGTRKSKWIQSAL